MYNVGSQGYKLFYFQIKGIKHFRIDTAIKIGK